MNINDLLKLAVERNASDLHLKVGSHPMVRIDGGLQPMPELKRLMQEDTISMAYSIMNARQKQRFKEELDSDLAYSVPGLGRFRCNIFQQRGVVGLVGIALGPLGVEPQFPQASDRLAGKGFVELPKINVIDLQACILQQTRDGKDRANAHFVGLAACYGEAAEHAHRGNAGFFHHFLTHDHNKSRPVTHL